MGLIAELLARTYHESQGKPSYTVSQTINFPEDHSQKPKDLKNQ